MGNKNTHESDSHIRISFNESDSCSLQIYSEYVQASEALFAEKEENKKLNEYMDQILKVNLH